MYKQDFNFFPQKLLMDLPVSNLVPGRGGIPVAGGGFEVQSWDGKLRSKQGAVESGTHTQGTAPARAGWGFPAVEGSGLPPRFRAQQSALSPGGHGERASGCNHKSLALPHTNWLIFCKLTSLSLSFLTCKMGKNHMSISGGC